MVRTICTNVDMALRIYFLKHNSIFHNNIVYIPIIVYEIHVPTYIIGKHC